MLSFAHSRKDLENLEPNFSAMKQAHHGALVMGVIVTVKGDGTSSYDSFSRFFAPLYGVNEDPVTGERVLKEFQVILSGPLTNILKMSVKSRYVPNEWKVANMSPNFKREKSQQS